MLRTARVNGIQRECGEKSAGYSVGAGPHVLTTVDEQIRRDITRLQVWTVQRGNWHGQEWRIDPQKGRHEMKVKTQIKAGKLAANHNVTMR